MVPELKLNTGAAMPGIGFGTWKIRLNSNAKKAVTEALKAGYRLVDTAHVYGNEKGVGQAINQSGLARSDIFVTTKVWNGDQGHQKALQAFDESLKKLGLDYIDLYLIHWPVTGKRQDTWRALEEIHQSSRARAIGVSNYTVRHLQELMNTNKIVPAVNQVEFHPFIYEDQRELLEFCKNHEIVVEAYSPLAHGLRLQDPTLSRLAEKHHKTNGQIMLRWAVQHGTVPLPKSTNPIHIKENLSIFDFELSAEDMTSINNLSDGDRTCWDPSKMP